MSKYLFVKKWAPTTIAFLSENQLNTKWVFCEALIIPINANEEYTV